ncbi:ImmA/IrrE family metallo-endopeptidase [Rhodococcus globerulus]|uniref:ImmA/IrrE family metallo-endopeptidase n=1 Tax=Rhodococcus globerulus TaxID=33008 RepID=UPI0039E77B5B
MEHLMERSDQLGLTVIRRALPPGIRGEYWHEKKLIVLSVSLTGRQEKSTFAHELGHAHYGHCVPGACRGDRNRQELQANDYAAKLLIAPGDYAAAEKIYGTHTESIAYHLGVTPAIVRAWRSLWKRRLSAQFSSPRHSDVVRVESFALPGGQNRNHAERAN